MKFNKIFAALGAAVLALVGCQPQEVDYGEAKLSVSPTSISAAAGGSTETLTIYATREWGVSVSSDAASWISVSPTSGSASLENQSVSVQILSNSEYARTGKVTVTLTSGGLALKTIEVSVSQEGAKGEVSLGSGTLEDPYTVAGVIAYTESLDADVQSDKSVYIKGKITRVSTTFKASGDYGNANFYIADAADGTGEFYVFQTYYLGNRKWKNGDTDVKEGDEVIVYGPVVNYKGNTPETVGKGASYIYSLNGNTTADEPGDEPGTSSGDGTLENPYNPAGAAAYAQSLGSDVQSDKSVYIKGKITRVSTTFEASGDYGNANFYIADAADGTGEFYVFQTYYLGNRKWKNGDTDVKEGDEVIVYGPVVNYKGNTPETVGKGASYIYSLNGKTASDQPGGGDEPGDDQAGKQDDTKGTVDSPYSVQMALYRAGLLDSNGKEENVYVKGKISAIDSKDAPGNSYGNATFWISDDGGTAGQLEVYRAYGLGGEKMTTSDYIKVGDEVIIYGTLVNFKGNTKEITQGGQIYSLNGKTASDQPGGGDEPGDNPGGDEPGTSSGDGTLASPYNPQAASDVAAALASGAKTDGDVYVAGKVSSVKYTFDVQHGTATFYISEDGTTSGTQFQCYSVYYLGNRAWVDGDTQIAVGDDVIIYGKLTNYNGTPETASKEAYIYSLNGNTTADQPGGGDEPGDNPGDNPGGGDAGEFSSNVTWTKVENAYPNDKVNVTYNGTTVSDVPCLKLGTSQKVGTATVTLPAGTTSLTFWGVSWKGKKATFEIQSGSSAIFSQELAVNDGASNNSPYSITVSSTDFYTVNFDSALSEDTTLTLTTNSSNTRVIVWGMNAR